METPIRHYAIWFTNGYERTARLIVDTKRFPLNTTIQKYSRLFPHSSCIFMKRFCRSSLYDSFKECFDARNDDMLIGEGR